MTDRRPQERKKGGRGEGEGWEGEFWCCRHGCDGKALSQKISQDYMVAIKALWLGLEVTTCREVEDFYRYTLFFIRTIL